MYMYYNQITQYTIKIELHVHNSIGVHSLTTPVHSVCSLMYTLYMYMFI